MVSHRMMHRTNQHQAIHDLGDLRQMLANHGPWHSCGYRLVFSSNVYRGKWFRVKRLKVARPTVEEHQNACLDWRASYFTSAALVRTNHVRQRRTEPAYAADLQPAPSVEHSPTDILQTLAMAAHFETSVLS